MPSSGKERKSTVRNRFDVAEAISWAWIAITVPDTFSVFFRFLFRSCLLPGEFRPEPRVFRPQLLILRPQPSDLGR